MDIIIPTKDNPYRSYSAYIENWKEQMTEAYRVAAEHRSKHKIKDLDRNNNTGRC